MYGMYFAITALISLTIPEATYILVLRSFSNEIFSAMTSLIGTIAGVLLTAKGYAYLDPNRRSMLKMSLFSEVKNRREKTQETPHQREPAELIFDLKVILETYKKYVPIWISPVLLENERARTPKHEKDPAIPQPAAQTSSHPVE